VSPASRAGLGSLVLALLLLSPTVAAGSSGHAGPPSARELAPGSRPAPGPAYSPHARPLAAATLGAPLLSVSLCNGTVEPGLFTPECGLQDPTSIVYDSYADRLFFANNNSGVGPSYVSIFNATTFAYLGAIPTVGAADALAYDPVNGNLYIGDTGGDLYLQGTSGSVDVANASNGSIFARIPVAYPMGLAVDPAAMRLYVANWGTSGVRVFNLTSGAPVTNLSVQYAWTVVVDPVDHTVFAANFSGEWVYSEGNGTLLSSSTFAGWWTPEAWDSFDDRVYAGGSWPVVGVFDGSTGRLIGNVTPPSFPPRWR
jgi:hypothetical protein